VTEDLQTNDRPNIQTFALYTFTFSLQTFTIFFRINAFINVYYNFFDVYHIYAKEHPLIAPIATKFFLDQGCILFHKNSADFMSR